MLKVRHLTVSIKIPARLQIDGSASQRSWSTNSWKSECYFKRRRKNVLQAVRLNGSVTRLGAERAPREAETLRSKDCSPDLSPAATQTTTKRIQDCWAKQIQQLVSSLIRVSPLYFERVALKNVILHPLHHLGSGA